MPIGLQTFKNGQLDLDITSRYTRVLGQLVLPGVGSGLDPKPLVLERRATDSRFSLGTPFWLCTSDSTVGEVNGGWGDGYWSDPHWLIHWQATHPDVWMEGSTIIAKYDAVNQLGSTGTEAHIWGGCIVTYGIF